MNEKIEQDIEGWYHYGSNCTCNVHKVWSCDSTLRKYLVGTLDDNPHYNTYPTREIYIVKRNKWQDNYYLAVKYHTNTEENGTQFWYLPGFRFASLEAAAFAHRLLGERSLAKELLNGHR